MGVVMGQGCGAGKLRKLAPAPALRAQFICEKEKTSIGGRGMGDQETESIYIYTIFQKSPEWHLSCDLKGGWGR